MSYTDNPDAIAALAAKVLGTAHPRSSLRDSKPDLQHGPNLHVDSRTATVLDSIAGICIREAKSSVVAVALKLSLPTVQFIIASDDESKTPAIANHLTDVWNFLKAISDLTLSGLKRDDVDMESDTPDRGSNTSREMALVNSFYSYVYSYSCDAILRRFDKHEERLAAFVDILKASAEQPANDINIKVKDEILPVQVILEMILEMIPIIRETLESSKGNFKKTNKELREDLVTLTSYQHHLAKALLEPLSPFVKWVLELQERK
jgi:hypothetical protein